MTIRILVPIKRVVDANVRVRVSTSGVIDTTGLKMSLNPFDECAVEKALQLREAGVAAQVTVVTCGQSTSQDVLRAALAMGADDAVLIDTGAASARLDPRCTASTAPSPARATRTAAAAAVTSGQCRRAHRRARRPIGSRHAETGSSAIQRSTSSTRARAEL